MPRQAQTQLWLVGGETPQRLHRGDEITGAGQRRRVVGQRVADAIFRARHAIEHPGQPVLVCAEAHEQGAVLAGRAKGRVAPEDVLLLAASLARRRARQKHQRVACDQRRRQD